MQVRLVVASTFSRIAVLMLAGMSMRVIVVLFVIVCSSGVTAQSVRPPLKPGTVLIDVTPGHDLASFDPDEALGSSIDVFVASRH